MAEAAEGLELSGDASLKKILNNTIATIEDNKSQLFDIYESVRTEVEAAKKQLEDLKFQVRQTIERVDALEQRLAALTKEGRAGLKGIQAKRAPVILGGAVAVSELLRQTGFPSLTVSESDLLFGLSIVCAAILEGRESPVVWKPTMRPLGTSGA